MEQAVRITRGRVQTVQLVQTRLSVVEPFQQSLHSGVVAERITVVDRRDRLGDVVEEDQVVIILQLVWEQLDRVLTEEAAEQTVRMAAEAEA